VNSAYFDPPFAALAHRGFSRDGLENSMVAFAAARDLGFAYVETDAHATRDGVALALHDPTLDRTTDASGTVGDLPWRVVRGALIAGREPIPLLEDVLGTWPDLRVNVDVKASAAIGPVAGAIERTASHDRVLVTSFSDRRRRATLARLTRPVATSAAPGAIVATWAAARLPGGASTRAVARAVADLDCLQVPERAGRMWVASPATVRAVHAAGRRVHIWTVNEPADMRRLIGLGVDGIITDRADLLREVLIERGMWG
jgi:glycerophosphoryl diester phosphodiesterase